MTHHPGRRIGPYRIEGGLGVGGMGEVFRAYDTRLDRHVALKRVRTDVADSPGRQARLRREAWSVARLNHPSIVQIFDIVAEADGDWIVMEMVEGTNLAERLRAGTVDLASALTWGRQIAEALAEAHEKGVVHRDLKTENVVVDRSGRAKLLDFGLAKQVGLGAEPTKLTTSGMIVGTVRAMSPEQARGLPVDARADLFSLGVLLYELVTDLSPFDGVTSLDTLTRVAGHQQTPASEVDPLVPAELSALIDRLLEKSPELRPQSAGEVAGLLRRIAGASGTADSLDPGPVPAPPAAHGPTTVPRGRPAGVVETFGTSPVEVPDADPPADAVARPAPSPAPPLRPPWKRRAMFTGLVALLALIVAVPLAPRLRRAVAERLAGVPGEAEPSTAYEYYKRGMKLLERYDSKGNVERASDDFQRALRLDADSAPAHAGLARAYWRAYGIENYDASWLERALPIAEKAVSLDGFLVEGRISLGLVLAELGRETEGEDQFREVLLIDPGNAEAHAGFARIHEKRNALAEAEASYKKALDRRPDSAELCSRLGTVYFRSGRYAEAEARFRRSVELAPESPIGYESLAAVVFLQGRSQEAAEVIQAALAINPTSRLYSNLGNILFYQGLYSGAAAAYEKALGMGGGVYTLWGNLGDAYRWSPDGQEKAREAYSTAIRLAEEQRSAGSTEVTLHSRLTLYRAKAGECQRALSELDRPLAAGDASAETLYRCAVTYEICGQRTAALEALGAAVRAGYSPEEVKRDPELIQLRKDPRFQSLAL